MKVRVGDNVRIIAGKDKGKEGKVIRTLKKKDQVVVEGLNIVKKHSKPNNTNDKGGIFSIEAPIHVSNVKVIDTKATKEKAEKKTAEKKAPAKKAATSGGHKAPANTTRMVEMYNKDVKPKLMKQFGYINEEMLLTAIAYNSYFSKSIFDTIKECIRRERVI